MVIDHNGGRAERGEILGISRVNVRAGKGDVDIVLSLGNVATPDSGSSL
jgi:hypothetical protein